MNGKKYFKVTYKVEITAIVPEDAYEDPRIEKIIDVEKENFEQDPLMILDTDNDYKLDVTAEVVKEEEEEQSEQEGLKSLIERLNNVNIDNACNTKIVPGLDHAVALIHELPIFKK